MLSVKDLKTEMMVLVTDPRLPDVLRQSPAKIVDITEQNGFYMVTCEFVNVIDTPEPNQKAVGFSVLVHPGMVETRDFSELFTIISEDDPNYQVMTTPAASASVN